MPEDNYENFDNGFNNDIENEQSPVISNSFFDGNFLILLLILFIFFSNGDVFKEHFQFLEGHIKDVKSLLDIADASIQALDQASQIPQQMSK